MPLFEVPRVDLDVVGTPSDAAREVRRQWRVPAGPISNVTRVLEDAGVIIVERPMAEKLDAISISGPGERPIVLLNAHFSTERKRQTLCHELGHLVMHLWEVTADPEAEANEFGREFLMPARETLPELRSLRLQDLPDIKRRWKVSMRNVVYHARELGSISRDQARYLFMRMNQEFGAKSEPTKIPDEPPTLIAELIQRHLQDLGYTIDQVAAIANSRPDDFKAAFGLHERHLRVV